MEKWRGADGKDSSSSNMEYWIVSTTDDKGNKASIGGGMMRRQDSHQQITNFIDVNSVDDYSSKIQKLGGKWLFLKWQYQAWDILQYVMILRITVLVFGNLMRVQSNFLEVYLLALKLSVKRGNREIIAL
jgi:hypothetical protein